MTSSAYRDLISNQTNEQAALPQDRREAILAKVAAQTLDMGDTMFIGNSKRADRVVQRGQGYGAFGAAGRALREATGGAMLHPGDLVRRTADGGFQLMRRGKVLGEVLHDSANKGFAYAKGGSKSPTGRELSGPNFRSYGDLPRAQQGLVPKAPMMAKETPAVPKAVPAPQTVPKPPMSSAADDEGARMERLRSILPRTPLGRVDPSTRLFASTDKE